MEGLRSTRNSAIRARSSPMPWETCSSRTSAATQSAKFPRAELLLRWQVMEQRVFQETAGRPQRHNCPRLRAWLWTTRAISTSRTIGISASAWSRPVESSPRWRVMVTRASPATAGRQSTRGSWARKGYRWIAREACMSRIAIAIGMVRASRTFAKSRQAESSRPLAGNGTCCVSLGDGGPATSAQLEGAGAVAVDAAGNVFIADSWNLRVRKVSPDGIITTVAGVGTDGPPPPSGDGGPATAAQLGHRWASRWMRGEMCLSWRASQIRKVSPDGIIHTVPGADGNAIADDARATCSRRDSQFPKSRLAGR